MKRPIKRILAFLVVSAVALACLFAFRFALLSRAGTWLVDADEPAKSDLIYVFAGGVPERPAFAAELYEKGFAPKVAVGGMLISQDLMALDIMKNEADINEILVKQHGVPSSAVVKLLAGTSTFEEVRAVHDLMLERGWKNAILVTSPFHTRRVRFCVRKVFGKEKVSIRIVAAKDPIVDPANWWHEETGLLTITNEYIKTVYYHLKYR